MTQYAILIYGDEKAFQDQSPEAWSAMLDAHTAFAKAVADLGGTIKGGEALGMSGTATSVRDGVVTDGPFVDTKETFGGSTSSTRATSTTRCRSPSCARPRPAASRCARSSTPRGRDPDGRRGRARRSPTRTAASGPSCSPRRCASPATSTSPRSAPRRRTSTPSRRGRAQVPDRPGAWLTTAARRRAVDRLRREGTLRRKLPLLVEPGGVATGAALARGRTSTRRPRRPAPPRLHVLPPRPEPAARVALTLRLVCGVATPDVARAFLVSEPTMAARITRAKRKITQARIPYRTPSAEELPERLDSVLTTVHLLFSTGHTAPTGERLVREDVVRPGDRPRPHARVAAPRRARGPRPARPAAAHRRAARHPRRRRPAGCVLLEDQDRPPWDNTKILEGLGSRSTRCACRGRGGSRCRPRSQASTPSRPRSRRPTGRASSGSTTPSWPANPRRWSHSIAQRPWPSRRDPRRVWRPSTSSRRPRPGPARGLPLPAHHPRGPVCAAWAVAARRPRRTRPRWRSRRMPRNGTSSRAAGRHSWLDRAVQPVDRMVHRWACESGDTPSTLDHEVH